MSENFLSIRYEWSDADVMEVRTAFRCGDWGGSELAFVHRSELNDFADALDAVAGGATAAALVVGEESAGSTSTSLVVREIDVRRGLVMDIRLARVAGSIHMGSLRNAASRVERTVAIERGQLTGFASGLRAMVRAEAGGATLWLAGD